MGLRVTFGSTPSPQICSMHIPRRRRALPPKVGTEGFQEDRYTWARVAKTVNKVDVGV